MINQKIHYSDPVFYAVSVAGELMENTLEVLPNFFIGSFVYNYVDQISYIEGLVKDQIALSGLLIYLSDIHYILLSVNLSKDHGGISNGHKKI